MPVRKLIVKAFVREVILDNDSVTITHNFNISTKNLKWHLGVCLSLNKSARCARRDKHTPKCHLRVNIVLVFIFFPPPTKSLHLCKILIPFATILILSLWKRKYYDTDKHNRGFVCEQ